MLAEIRSRLGHELETLSRRLADLQFDAVAGLRNTGPNAANEHIQRQIRFIGQLIAGLAGADSKAIPIDRIGLGSEVQVRELDTGEIRSYTLMRGDQIDIDDGQVSLESPLGHALLGQVRGAVVTVVTPRGPRHFEITDVITLPAWLGLEAEPESAVH